MDPIPINGTPGDDTLIGGEGGDRLRGLAGDDLLSGGGGDDRLRGGIGNDRLIGGSGADTLGGGDGDDVLDGGLDGDRLVGAHGDDILFGREGNDDLFGGPGNDVLHGGIGTNRLVGGEGIDTASYALIDVPLLIELTVDPGETPTARDETSALLDRLEGIENIVGSSAVDSITGDTESNRLVGRGGDDLLFGLGGDDRLRGGRGSDTLTGGTGADRFIFGNTSEVPGDRIVDFSRAQGDRIAVNGIDPITDTPANEAFTFIGFGDVGAAGQISFRQDGTDTLVQVGVQIDVKQITPGEPAFGAVLLRLSGLIDLAAGDFVL